MDGADTPLIQSRVKELQEQIKPYSKNKGSSSKVAFSFQNMLSSTKLYYILPIAIFFILVFWKPGFLHNEDGDEDGNIVLKFSYTKLFMYWIIVSLAVVIGLFGYNYKKVD